MCGGGFIQRTSRVVKPLKNLSRVKPFIPLSFELKVSHTLLSNSGLMNSAAEG